jgi:hypothetical protein
MRWAGHVAAVVEKTKRDDILVGKPGGKRRRRRWDNIKLDIAEIYNKDVD